MAEYNFNDISEAKKRVREMQSRVKDKNTEVKGGSLLSLLEGISSQRDRAFLLSVIYYLSLQEPDSEFLDSIIAIFL